LRSQSLFTSNPVPKSLWFVIAPLALFELALSTGDFLGQHWRDIATFFLGLWPSLWGQAEGLYPGQAFTALFTYGLMHGDMMHMLFNCLWLVIFGRAVLAVVSFKHFLAILTAGTVAGGIAYLLLSSGNTPVIGISGGAYAIVTFWTAGFMRDKYIETQSLKPVLGVLGLLAFVTLALPLMMPSNVAWEAHLGGALLGLAWGAKMYWPKDPPQTPQRKAPHLRVVSNND
jgi:membrane associated rhomboid family serine protease